MAFIRMSDQIEHGDVFWCQLPIQAGNTTQGKRPVIIVSNNNNNKYSSNVTIVPLTTNTDKAGTQPTHIAVKALEDSVALCEEIRTISKTYLGTKIGCFDQEDMSRVILGIMCQIDAFKYSKSKSEDTSSEKEYEEKPRITKRICDKQTIKQFLDDNDRLTVDEMMKKYNISTRTAVYQRVSKYRKKFK